MNFKGVFLDQYSPYVYLTLHLAISMTCTLPEEDVFVDISLEEFCDDEKIELLLPFEETLIHETIDFIEIPEILHNIYQFCLISDIGSMLLVSRTFHAVGTTNLLWQALIKQRSVGKYLVEEDGEVGGYLIDITFSDSESTPFSSTFEKMRIHLNIHHQQYKRSKVENEMLLADLRKKQMEDLVINFLFGFALTIGLALFCCIFPPLALVCGYIILNKFVYKPDKDSLRILEAINFCDMIMAVMATLILTCFCCLPVSVIVGGSCLLVWTVRTTSLVTSDCFFYLTSPTYLLMKMRQRWWIILACTDCIGDKISYAFEVLGDYEFGKKIIVASLGLLTREQSCV